MHLGYCSTFGKRKKSSRVTVCVDDAILHRKPYGIPLEIRVREKRFIYTVKSQIEFSR